MEVLESTANGLVGDGELFHNEWRAAIRGKSKLCPIFIPWFSMPKYRQDPPLPEDEWDEEEKLLCKKPVDLLFSRLFLYEEMTRYIRGVCVQPKVGRSYEYGPYLPSLDDPLLYKNRKRLIYAITNHPYFFYVSGPLHKICAEIMR